MPTDTNPVEMSPQTERIAFTLSETSFAQYPPLEIHDGAFPTLATPDMAPTPTLGGGQTSPMPYPISDAHTLPRGDSYVHGLSGVVGKMDPSNDVSSFMVQAALAYPPPPHKNGPLVMVCSYTEFSDLAHGPRGTPAERAVRTYRLDLIDGSLTLLSALPKGFAHNPAFCRKHPHLNVVYSCTESVKQDGQVLALKVDQKTGALSEHCPPVSAGGTSTCYLTIHKAARRMLLVNYWDSTICTLELLADGKIGRHLATYDPKQGREMKARADKHVNHSLNDEKAQAERQGDPHSHAIVLEPTSGCIAYVPDLGMDVIRQFHFDEATGTVTPCGVIPSGIKAGKRGLGPRYLIFAKDTPTCYVVNELSSQVAVFSYDAGVAASIAKTWEEVKGAQSITDGDNSSSSSSTSDDGADDDKDMTPKPTTEELKADAMSAAMQKPTLTLIQTVSTVPEAFPFEMNTCGRVTLHPSGDFVITSNRGHDSVAVHRVHRDSSPPGMLTLAGIFHTRGETPRHFQFDRSGQWLLVANQDSNTCAVFAFNTATGRVTYTGNTYSCQSPNFVCVWDGA